jgi:hypothetical protein
MTVTDACKAWACADELGAPVTCVTMNQNSGTVELYLDCRRLYDPAVLCDTMAQVFGRLGYQWDVWRPTCYVIAVAERRQK